MFSRTKPSKDSMNTGKTPKRRLIRFAVIGLSAVTAAMMVGAVGVGAGAMAAFAKHEKLREKEDFEKDLTGWSQTSYAYFRPVNGQPKLIGSMITEDDRQLVKDLDEVSPFLINALISTEDREFFTHKGIVPKAIFRAVLQQVSGSDTQTGGSTLTQQLVKNEIINSREKSFKRKALEIVNAIRIEKYYDKEEILIKYLNSVEFGRGAHGTKMIGFKAAARGIFNKKLDELNLAQAAYLAGMVQRPYDLNPFGKEEKLKKGLQRMELVLTKMVENGKITQAEKEEALKFDLKGSLAKPTDFVKGYERYPYIISAVERETAEILKQLDKGNPEAASKKDKDYINQVRQGGYKIYTTIDEQLYNEMNDSVKKINFPKRKYRGKVLKEQIGAVLIDNKTGAILSFVSGRDFKENQQDFALEETNQPGSTIKPLLVYGPAIHEGMISKDSIIIDEPVPRADGSGTYKNSNNQYAGPVTATVALQKSLNTPAIKIFQKLGVQHGFDYLRKMNMHPHKWDSEASALGGMSAGFTPKQMTAGFAMIANHGMYNNPYLVEKIVDADGNVVYEHAKNHQPKQIISPQAAFELTQMLRTVLLPGGTASTIGAELAGWNIAGKTGTSSGYNDLWFIGYTPEVSLGVWTGYEYNLPADKDLSKKAWTRLFKTIVKTQPNLVPRGSNFTNPGGMIEPKCFECDKVPAQPTDPESPGDGNPQTQPGTQNPQPGNTQPGQIKNPGITPPSGDPSNQPQQTPDGSNDGQQTGNAGNLGLIGGLLPKKP
ncbi:transglycosylase domain-containing protein [Staphylospora marina]|uniref:transglycosylase domain-containing protein n=1 Tax=Staphylospora marina TaxID=2490858 RepID=UPI0013DE1E06|nr:transglycosylase domain-containing protein [Staphylospora marina]